MTNEQERRIKSQSRSIRLLWLTLLYSCVVTGGLRRCESKYQNLQIEALAEVAGVELDERRLRHEVVNDTWFGLIGEYKEPPQ